MTTATRALAMAALCLAGLQGMRAQQMPATPVMYNNDIAVDLACGLWAVPMPVDYDGDGLKDLILLAPDKPYHGTYYFRNIGTADAPFFDKAVKLSDEADEYYRYSEANGVPYVMAPGVQYRHFFKDLYGQADSLAIPDEPSKRFKSPRNRSWNRVDWDGDGDADLVIGVGVWDDYGWDRAFDADGNWTKGPLHGHVYLYENVDGTFVSRGQVEAGGKPVDTYGAPSPCLADFDGDGDLDMICGEFLDGLTWFENIGTRQKPVFAEGRPLVDNQGRRVHVHVEMIVPVCTDFNGDGLPDLLLGDEDATVRLLLNTGKVKDGMPQFEDKGRLKQKADWLKFGALVTPFAIDWDGDGRTDIIAGNSAGDIGLIRNLGGGDNPSWAEPVLLRVGDKPFRVMAGLNGSVQGPAERKWGYTAPVAADVNGDGLPDIVYNSIWGKIEWLKNLGSADGLQFDEPRSVHVDWEGTPPKPAWNWWNPQPGELVTQWRTTPLVTDWDGDGVLDIIMLDTEGYLAFYKGIKVDGDDMRVEPGRRVFYGTNCSWYSNEWAFKGPTSVYDDSLEGIKDGTTGPLRLNSRKGGGSGRRKLCLVDWDNDGRMDLMVDGLTAVWFRNVRDANGITWLEYKGNVSKANLVNHTVSPTPVDWNGDGVYDLLLGAEDGHFYLVKNPQKP